MHRNRFLNVLSFLRQFVNFWPGVELVVKLRVAGEVLWFQCSLDALVWHITLYACGRKLVWTISLGYRCRDACTVVSDVLFAFQ